MFGRKSKSVESYFPLSTADNLGPDFEREYDALGDQGMAREYGRKFDGAERVPEIYNMPFFGPEGAAAADEMANIKTAGYDTKRDYAIITALELGQVAYGGDELIEYSSALDTLAEALADTDAEAGKLASLETAVDQAAERLRASLERSNTL